MNNPEEDDLDLVGAEGALIKKITDDKADKKTEAFDPGMSMLGTDNEAGAMPDPDGMAEAQRAQALTTVEPSPAGGMTAARLLPDARRIAALRLRASVIGPASS